MALPNYASYADYKKSAAYKALPRTPLPAGANPSAYNYQQSYLNQATRYGVPQMQASGDPSQNAATKGIFTNAADAAYARWLQLPENQHLSNWWKGDPRYDPSAAGYESQNAYGVKFSDPNALHPDLWKAANPHPSGAWINENGQVAYDPNVPGAAEQAAAMSRSFTPAPLPGGINEPGEPFVPVGGQVTGNPRFMMTGTSGDPLYGTPAALGNMGGTPLPSGASTPSQPPTIPNVGMTPTVIGQEQDPTGSLWDAFQRSLQQATMPAQFRATWGGG